MDGDMDWQPEMWLIIPFSFGSAASLGLIDASVLGFIDLESVIWDPGNIELTWGRILAVASLLAVFFNREVGFTTTSFVDAWIVWATIALIVAPPLFPAFEATIAETPMAMMAFIVQTTGFTIVSYMN